jgi:hypothetical protein
MLSKYEGKLLTRLTMMACSCLRKMVRASLPGYCPRFIELPLLKWNKGSSSGNWLWNMQYKVQVCVGCEVCWGGRSAVLAQKISLCQSLHLRAFEYTKHCITHTTTRQVVQKCDKYAIPITLLVPTFLILASKT